MRFAKSSLGLLVTCLLVSIDTIAQEAQQHHSHIEEELVVTAPFDRRVSETALPVNVLTGEKLNRVVASSLGETLKGEAGVHSASFGNGVGKAVIRGQSGNRVQVIENNLGVIDVAAISPDHADGVEPLLAQKIEVLRGPSTLLYGNGAIGGVVNVLKDSIPEGAYSRPEFAVEQAHSSVNEENKTVFRFGASSGLFNVYLDGFRRDNDDVEIPGFAIDDIVLEDSSPNTRGFVANSNGEADGGTIGFSVAGARGFVGLSTSWLSSEYGLPPGSHAHDEHDEEDHDGGEHAEEEHAEEEETPFVRLDMERKVQAIRAGFTPGGEFVEAVSFHLSRTDYKHREIEFEGMERHTGTLFESDGLEGRITLMHKPVGGWEGLIGIQFGSSDFSALGDESFIPRTDRETLALFAVERYQQGQATWELGLRSESTELDPGPGCANDETTVSVSAGLLYDFERGSNFLATLSRSERAPTIEELYSNVNPAGCAVHADPEALVLHAATGLIEAGNPALDEETATNLELGYRFDIADWEVKANAFYNRIDGYVFLSDTFAEIEEQPVYEFRAQDATFYGVETELHKRLVRSGIGELDLTLSADMVRASFNDGGDVPRIPPARIRLSLDYHRGSWTAGLSATRVFEQDNTGAGELVTDGYTLVNLHADYHLLLGEGSLMLYARGDNLLNEEIRSHTSFLKNNSPEAGRGWRVGIRYIY